MRIKKKVAEAKAHIESISAAPVRKQMEYKVGENYQGKIKKIVDFGIFVEMPDCYDALLDISKVAKEHVNNLSERYSEGDAITVVVMEQKGKKIELATPEFFSITVLYSLFLIKIEQRNSLINPI